MSTPAAPVKPAATRSRVRSPADLAAMELRSTEDVAAYCQAARELCRAIALEMHSTSAELQTKLTSRDVAAGGVAHRVMVRRTLRQLRVAAGNADSAGDAVARFWKDYLRNFAALIDPHKARTGWKWERS
jgi:hypothetical protein